MPLPFIPHRRVMVDVGGDDKVEIRGMTRAEAAHVPTILADETMSDEARRIAAEVFILACGSDSTEEEAETWYSSVPQNAAGAVLDAIQELSGLTEGAQKSVPTNVHARGGSDL